MAKLCKESANAMQAGFAAAHPQNPHIWSSSMWESWEFGRYMGQTGRPIDNIEKGRGCTFRTPSGATFKMSYSKSKGGGSFGFHRTG